MKVRDYVRTKDGKIGKLQQKDYTYAKKWIMDTVYYDFDEIIDKWTCGVMECNIIKSSPNIKSVIEKDDFVNGERVNRVIPEDICGDDILDYQHIFVADKEIYEEDIKSIVTHEQFKSMEYEVK